MSARRTPESLAREAGAVLVVGLGLLTVAALVLYRPGAPRWTHLVVNGTGWALIVSTGAMFLVAALRKAAELGRRRHSH